MSNQLTSECRVCCFEQIPPPLFQYGCHRILLELAPGAVPKPITLVNLVDFAFNHTRSRQTSWPALDLKRIGRQKATLAHAVRSS
jgi:hypothetical protein